MNFFDKYLYLFDLWNADLLKPFEDEFFTNAKEREVQHNANKITKYIEFEKDDKTLISFQFVIAKDINEHLIVWFDLTTFINGRGYYTPGHNEFYLYDHKDKLKEIVDFLSEKVIEIKRVLHNNEGQRVRFAVGMDLYDNYPQLLNKTLQEVLNTTESEYKILVKRYGKLLKLKR